VLVRRYQNQGITLPSRASSPSEPRTPSALSHYSPDEDYMTYNSDAFGNLMPPQTQGTSSGSHRSWSSFSSESMTAWSSSGEYDLPMVLPTADMTHATSALPDYAYAPPPNPSNQWNWATTPMDIAAPMQAQSPVSYSMPPQHSAPAHYDDYDNAQPVSRSYSRSPARATYAATPDARTWSEHQHYDSLGPTTTYTDPSLQDPLYRF
jgi:hypothetical protein